MERLFDVGPEPEPAEKLGQDAQRTARRRELLAAGVHPTTGRRLREPLGAETCGTCDHHSAEAIRSGRVFHKCNAVPGGATHGPATDVRVSWPACTAWEPVEPRSWAELSPDELYRWTLGRRWGRKGGRRIAWVMLNPSTADHELDDQTIRRCGFYSDRAGFSELVVVNLFAYRATQPDDLLTVDDPVGGPENARRITDAIDSAEAVAVAWGATLRRIAQAAGRYPDLGRHVIDYATRAGKPVLCLGYTADGSPRHPSRLGNDVRLVPYAPPAFGGPCSTCGGEGTVERLATPEEVDAGYELGIAFDPCPTCQR